MEYGMEWNRTEPDTHNYLYRLNEIQFIFVKFLILRRYKTF